MTKPDRQARPRSWPELRRRVLEDGYLDLEELREKRRKAATLKRVVWLVPLFAVGLLAVASQDGGIEWYWWLALAAVVYGAVDGYRIGARWERRWDELIRERSAPP